MKRCTTGLQEPSWALAKYHNGQGNQGWVEASGRTVSQTQLSHLFCWEMKSQHLFLRLRKSYSVCHILFSFQGNPAHHCDSASPIVSGFHEAVIKERVTSFTEKKESQPSLSLHTHPLKYYPPVFTCSSRCSLF